VRTSTPAVRARSACSYNRAVTPEVLAALADAMASGETVALVTIVSAHGSTPQRVGAKMVVYRDGRTVGTIGGGCYEHESVGKAREALRTRRALTARYELSDDFAEETGLICGGRMDVFIEPIEAPPQLVILGAGHVGHELGRLAAGLGFRVVVVDDRQKFANAERFPDAAAVVVDDIPGWALRTPLPPSAFVVVLTRGHRQDYDAMRALAGRELRYIGLIGSRAKVARIVDRLVSEGVSPDWLRTVRAPVGLDIGAVTPEEIAVSILGELVAVRRGRIGDPHAGRPLQWTAPTLRTDANPALATPD
jgi:xanthine dehydrogenase accessory factor